MHTANLSPDKTIHIIIFTTAFEIAVYTIHCILNTVNYRRHCIPKPPSSLASFESRLVLPFWYRLTRVVLENRLLNGCSSSSSKTFVTNCASCINSKSQHTATFNDCNVWFKRVTITLSYLHHLLPCHQTHSLPGCVRAETGSDDCAGFCWC